MKKKVFIIAIAFIAIIGIATFKMFQSGNIRVGVADANYGIFQAGTYTVGENLKLKDGKYAVYALEGTGTVIVDGKKYSVSDRSYKKAQKDGLPENTRNGVLYEESSKIVIKKGSKIVVKGQKNLKISFIDR